MMAVAQENKSMENAVANTYREEENRRNGREQATTS